MIEDILGHQLATVGRLPYLGALAYTGEDGPGLRRHNSAQRLASLWPAFEIPADVREALRGLDGPVLVMDDRIETGWTMTVAARLLREAGARAVLPLVLAAGAGSTTRNGTQLTVYTCNNGANQHWSLP